MLTYNNQENVVSQAPQGGNGKALLQTPAPGKMAMKTPFKIPLKNDENGAGSMHPQTGGKKSIFAGKDPLQFVTPVGPRRQALTGKTTNLKARSLAPSAEQARTGKGSFNRQSTKLVVSETAEVAATDDVPEIEYMPPGPHEIPFTPEGFEESLDFTYLKNNYMRGCHRAYLAGIDEDGKSSLQRTLEANQRRLNAELDAETEELVAKISRKPSLATRRMEDQKPAMTTSSSRAASSASTARPTSRAGTATARPTSRAGTSSSRPSSRAGSTTTRPTSSRPSSRTSVRPPASTASLSRPTASSNARSVSTADSRKAAEMLSQRPRSTSTSRPTTSTRPTSSHGVKKSFTTNTKPIPAPKTLGYRAGREIRDGVKAGVSQVRLESALDAIERIQREDAAAEELGLPPIILEEEEDVVVDMPSPLVLEEDYFVFTLGA
ncbi:hypothetical protein FN846DRAFT_623078 [Sphaerosporella brunnea]|uniref:Uncharacterized protein n=1 Tax=Sphaerosporella brunnea TaxID=1250544 RepID=A0A5J5F1Y3_9PEZI|nr:hypothetical protein FN846DRAFT_623078 [Sphaerosporella brunnea]